MSKSGYIVICTVDREIYRLNGGNVFKNPGEASDCMLSDFKNDFENHMLNNYEPDEIEQIMEQIDDFDYDDGDCGISATDAYLTTGDKNYDWSIINVYFDDAENSDNSEDETITFGKCETFTQAIQRAKEKIEEYNENYDRDNLMYWRGVLRGLEAALKLQQDSESLYKRVIKGFYSLEDGIKVIEDGKIHLLTKDENEVWQSAHDGYESYQDMFYRLEINEAIEGDIGDWSGSGDLYVYGAWSYPVSLEDIKALIEDGAEINIDKFIKED